MLLSRSALLMLVFLTAFMLLTACQRGVYHRVEPGQTIFRISRTYGVDSHYLARINNISDPTRLRAGSRLFIPGAERQLNVAVVSPRSTTSSPPRPEAPPKTTPRPAPSPVPVPQPPKQKTPPSTSTPTVSTTAPQKKFDWPLQGRIVRKFSSAAQAGSGRGIEIAAQSGTTVHAAEAGRVIYSGDGVSGYGHLVILQHDNQLFTVYGFNQRNLVKQGAFVSRGDKIALSGTPPSGGEPRLHFEVRSGKEPVNPQRYLP
ncbi:MAG: M23 family metallopeptidase [Pelovirga sp.]